MITGSLSLPSFFLFSAPPTFRVPFSFASSPLSESLEQGNTHSDLFSLRPNILNISRGKETGEEVKCQILAKAMSSSDNAGVVGSRVILGTLKRANKIIQARNYLAMYAEI